MASRVLQAQRKLIFTAALVLVVVLAAIFFGAVLTVFPASLMIPVLMIALATVLFFLWA